MTAETLRKWVRQAEVDAGEAAGVPTETARELRELRRKNRELEQTKYSRPRRLSSRRSATRYTRTPDMAQELLQGHRWDLVL